MNISFFIPLLLLIGTSNASTYSEVSNFFSKKGIGPVAMVALGIVILITITVVVLSEIRKAEKFHNKKAEIGWGKFKVLAGEKRLTAEEVSLLEKILSFNDSPNYELVFTSAMVFENSLEAFYKKYESNLKEGVFEQIRDLREVLGYSKIPNEVPYTSTRQFQNQTPIKIVYGDQLSQGRIESVTEADWAISGIASSDVEVGKAIKISFTRSGDSEYTLHGAVMGTEEGTIVVKHSRNLSRQQLRNWVRIDLSLPVIVRTRIKDRNENDLDLEFKGKMLDLSGGGTSFKLPEKLRDRSTVFLSFDLPKHSFKGLKAIVTRVNQTPMGVENLYRHSLEFFELDTVEREKIIRFVFDKQRQDNQWR